MTVDQGARSPLADRGSDLSFVEATEVAFLSQVSVRIDIREALGQHPFQPPTVPNTWSTDGDQEWLWLGPDEWLVVGPPDAASRIAEGLEAALAGRHHSVVDVSANRTILELEADGRRELLAHGCGLDLHPRSWAAGSCAQTLFARVPVILQERDRTTRVFVRPSFAGYLVDWLLAVVGA